MSDADAHVQTLTPRERAFPDGGAVGAMMRAHDWSQSTLGQPDKWPQSLRSVAALLLGSKFPMFVAWGQELGFLYNDAYAEILGPKHPEALGARFSDIWEEIWPDISPLVDAALAGEATYHEDLPLIINRRGLDERAWFTFSYSPVYEESGRVAGLFCAVAETTGKVVADQRQSFVVALGDRLADLTDPVALTSTAAELLGRQLGVDRAGYGEVDSSGENVSVTRDWTNGSTASLAGEARVLDAFGPDIIAELRTGRTLVVEDCRSDPRACRADYLTTWDSIDTRALIVAPLVNNNRLVAILYVHSATPRAWSDLEARLVEDVGARTWAALERARAEAALRESKAALVAEVKALERLQEVSTRMVGDEDPQALYDAILAAAADLMKSECASLQMLDAAGDLQLLAHRGYDPRSVAYWQTVGISSQSTCGVALAEARRVVVPDVEHSSLAPDSADLQSYRWTGMRAVQTTPLLSRSGRPLGMISTHWKRPHTPSERDLKLFDVLARQAADAIERMTAQAALRESEARQAFLLSLSDELRLLSTPSAIATVAAERLGECFGLSRAFYAEISGSLMKVNCDYTKGVDSIAGEHDLTAFGPELLRAYHECPVVKVDDVGTDTRFSDDARAALLARQVGAYLDVVLFEDGRFVSVLALQSATPRSWSASEEGLFLEVGERVRAATERARAESQLRELNDTLEQRVGQVLAERNLLAKLVESTDVMIMALGLDYDILAMNAANADEIERVYSVRPRAGDNLLELLADQPEHQEQVRAGWARALRGEQVTIVEDFGDPDRDRPYYEVKFRPLRDDAGTLVGAYQFATDITDRLRREAQLAEAQDALRQAQKIEAIGQLTGGVAHDFNNLLGAVVGNLDLLSRRLGDERLRRYVDGAMAGAQRGAQLTRQLLAFARRQRLVPQTVDLNALVESTVTNLLRRALGGMIEVELIAADDLWPATVDASQLESAILNLALNARDAMPEGGAIAIETSNVRVSEGTHADLTPGDYVLVAVTDTGAGMPPEVAARATEPFFTTKGVGKGTGLGLSTVYGFLRQSGGTMRITSHPGEGTTVQLYLPRSAEAPVIAAEESEPVEPHSSGEIALVVDDDDDVRATTAELLSELGYAVVAAQSGPRALEILAGNPAIRLLVTDYAMPGMNGAELLRRARDMRPKLKVVVATGYAQDAELDRSLAAAVLRKPFSLAQLAAGLRVVE